MPEKKLLQSNLNENIPIENIYYMLSYILDSPIPSVVKNLAPEDFDNAYNFYASLLIKDLDHIIKQGFYREYLDICEDITTVRGKINMPGTIKNKLSRKRLINCEHDELSENILLNQVLKATMLFLCKSNQIDSKYEKTIKKNLWRFSSVDTIDPVLIPWANINFHQNNQHYRFLLSLCWLILRSFLLTTNAGWKNLVTIDWYGEAFNFYEAFIRAYYFKKYKKLFVLRRYFDWSLDGGPSEYLPGMEFDIMLTDGHKSLIIDAKYCGKILAPGKKSKNLTLSSDNLYQIFTYVKNWQAKLDNPNSKVFYNKRAQFKPGQHIVAGMLLYAGTNEKIQPDIKYKMSGNEIFVKTLNLNCVPKKIDDQLDKIVNDFFEKETFIAPIKAV